MASLYSYFENNLLKENQRYLVYHSYTAKELHEINILEVYDDYIKVYWLNNEGDEIDKWFYPHELGFFEVVKQLEDIEDTNNTLILS